jgi:mono/diheme cytochrome c family protein
VKANKRGGRGLLVAGGFGVLAVAALAWVAAAPPGARAGFGLLDWFRGGCGHADCCGGPPPGDVGGTWYWLRSPDEERRVVSALFNRYCIRCHGVDGRGVWDMPDIPDFTDPRWQSCRSDDELARIILEGRGAVMPPFRGTLTLEESWAMARYLRTFAEPPASRPDVGRGGEQRQPGPGAAPGREQVPAPRPGPGTLPMPGPGQ